MTLRVFIEKVTENLIGDSAKDPAGNHWYVYNNIDLRREEEFDTEAEAKIFAQAWADGISSVEGEVCEVVLLDESESPNDFILNDIIPDDIIEEDKEEYFWTESDAIMLLNVMTDLSKIAGALVDFNKLANYLTKVLTPINIKRIYLGTVYSYNILIRFKGVLKSPKLIMRLAKMISWVFLHLPERLILMWHMPELRD